MQGVVAGFGELLVGSDRQEHVGRLHGDLEVEEVLVLQEAGMAERALDHRLGARFAVALQQLPLQRAGIDADADGAAMVARRLDDLPDAVPAADVAGVDAQARGAILRRLDPARSEEHTSELPSLMRISYAVFCLNKTK